MRENLKKTSIAKEVNLHSLRWAAMKKSVRAAEPSVTATTVAVTATVPNARRPNRLSGLTTWCIQPCP